MRSSSGSVLLMALITSAILYLVAVTLLLLTMTEVQISDFESRSTQALYAAESSVTLGLSYLRQEHNYRATASDTMMIGPPSRQVDRFQRHRFRNRGAVNELADRNEHL